MYTWWMLRFRCFFCCRCFVVDPPGSPPPPPSCRHQLENSRQPCFTAHSSLSRRVLACVFHATGWEFTVTKIVKIFFISFCQTLKQSTTIFSTHPSSRPHTSVMPPSPSIFHNGFSGFSPLVFVTAPLS